MTKRQIKKWIKNIYLIAGLAFAFVSAVLLWYWNVGAGWDEGYRGFRTLIYVGILYCAVYFMFAKIYKAHNIGAYRLMELTFSQSLAYGIADVILYGAAFLWFHNFERIEAPLFIVVFMVQIALTGVLTFVMNRLHARFDEPRKVAVVYGNESYPQLLEKMERFNRRYEILDCMDQYTNSEELYEVLQRCEDVYLYEVEDRIRQEIILFCDRQGCDIHFSIDISDVMVRSYEVSHFFDTPLLRNKKTDVVWYYPIVKRLMDIVLSLTGLIISSPFMLLTAIAIKVEDGGPVFYRQKRLTVNNRVFEIYKFRSMKVNAGKSSSLAMKHDDRITKVGAVIRRFRIDEIPQLLNILKGDMTIVGPRPEQPDIASSYEKTFPQFSLRLKVKAGLTGYAQVYGKYNTSPVDKLKLDLIYISQRSVIMDLKIMFCTVKILFLPDSTEGF